MEEILLGKNSRDKLLKGINKLANAVKVTLGPNGKTVILQDEHGKPYNTKDGVSVAKAIKLKDSVENIGVQMVKEVAKKTADEAGDGTTTATVLIQSFINEGINFLNNGGNYNDLKDIFNKSIPSIIKKLKLSANIIDSSNIIDVATISANNDSKIGEMIQIAFNYSNIVKVEKSKELEDKIDFIEGSVYPVTYFSKLFITDESKGISELKNPKVLLLDCELNDISKIDNILHYCNEHQEPLLIITESIGLDDLKLLETNQINGALKLLPIKTPGYAQYRKEYIKDISSLTGATIVNNLSRGVSIESLGNLKAVISKSDNTILIPKDSENINDRINQLIELKKHESDDYSREVLQNRIDNLNGKVSIIKVGGRSEIEMIERFDRYDDAVKASSSALEEGIVKGGGLALYSISKNNKYHPIINNTLESPTKTIIDNGTPSSILSNLSDNVVDPVKVTRCALENAASIALVILGTEAIVLNEYLW